MIGIPQFIFVGLALQQVEQAVLTNIFFAVEIDHQPGIQVTIVPELVIEVFMNEMKIFEDRIIGNKGHQGAVGFAVLASLYSLIRTPRSNSAVFSLPSRKAVTLK